MITSGAMKEVLSLAKKDIYILAGLVLFFSLIYLPFLYYIPHQINTDEITIMIFEKMLTENGPSFSGLFQLLQGYFYFPAFSFIVFGWLGRMLGGITLENMRLIHALSGLAIIGISYLFFLFLFQKRLPAMTASLILGSNHGLLAISRMAMRDNSGLFVELASLVLLYIGFKRRSLACSFLGGAVAGLSFYVYFPSRITIFIWIVFNVLVWLFLRPQVNFRGLVKLFLASILGFVMVAIPIISETIKNLPEATSYQREQFLIFPEGRDLEQEWTGTASHWEAVRTNIKNGLLTFNMPLNDNGYIYLNRGYGFVDPLTGILIWFGLAGLIFKIFKRKADEKEFLILSGFLILFLSFSLLVTKSPNYTRLLVILPFVACLAVEGLLAIGEAMRYVFKIHSGRMKLIFCFAGLSVIFVWNMMIWSNFVINGFRSGNDVGGTARYVVSRSGIQGYSFYLAASPRYPYYSWGQAWQWEAWLGYFKNEEFQYSEVIDPEYALSIPRSPPFTIFMNRQLFNSSVDRLHVEYSNILIHNIKPDGSLVAIEVLNN